MKVMVISHRIYQLIGLSQKAGKLISGAYAGEKAIKSGKAELVIVSEEASFNTIKKFSDICSYRNIDMIKVGSKEALGKSIGKEDRTIVVITDRAFKDMILDVLPSSIINTEVSD